MLKIKKGKKLIPPIWEMNTFTATTGLPFI